MSICCSSRSNRQYQMLSLPCLGRLFTLQSTIRYASNWSDLFILFSNRLTVGHGVELSLSAAQPVRAVQQVPFEPQKSRVRRLALRRLPLRSAATIHSIAEHPRSWEYWRHDPNERIRYEPQ